jgi:hypothetical protein
MDLQEICRATLGAHYPALREAEIVATFYPYITLTHTIRRRGGRWLVRISDHCRDAPVLVLQAIVLILGSKIMRRRPPEDAVRLYRQFASSPAIRHRVLERRRCRSRKHLGPAKGKTHCLDEIFREINRNFFGDRVEISGLGWGLRRGWTRLGHYDPVHRTITVSPVLDSPQVPRSAVAYILYHEMLHSLFDEAAGGRRNSRHPAAFRRAERAFPDYAGAREFLKRFCSRRGCVRCGE